MYFLRSPESTNWNESRRPSGLRGGVTGSVLEKLIQVQLILLADSFEQAHSDDLIILICSISLSQRHAEH